MSLRLSLLLACTFAAATTATVTWAGSNISAQYDGIYEGQAKPNTAISTGVGCAPFVVGRVSISQGNLKSQSAPGAASVSGFITEDGYVRGALTRPGGDRNTLEGRLSGNTITAGFLETNSGCAWLVELKRES